MERILIYTITKEHNTTSLSDFLKSLGFSHKNLVSLKKMPQSILVNGTYTYMKTPLQLNDVVQIHITEHTSSENITAVNLPFSIIYEDKDILVINKPANMPTHPSVNNRDNTLANAIAYYYQKQDIPFTFRCINRLDRDTTGLTILAKHMLSANLLSKMMCNRNIKRNYLAIVEGKPLNQGIISAPIGRMENSIIKREVNLVLGEHAITHYQLLSYNPSNNLSLLSLYLETGRTHQIRVHMKSIGHPLIGDFLYNPNMQSINRQALHAHQLEFLHPITGASLTFEAPLPRDMDIFDS